MSRLQLGDDVGPESMRRKNGQPFSRLCYVALYIAFAGARNCELDLGPMKRWTNFVSAVRLTIRAIHISSFRGRCHFPPACLACFAFSSLGHTCQKMAEGSPVHLLPTVARVSCPCCSMFRLRCLSSSRNVVLSVLCVVMARACFSRASNTSYDCSKYSHWPHSRSWPACRY